MNKSCPGILVVGTEPGCGKTVALTGLAATLKEEGFAVRAIKPICIGDKKTSAPELEFISTISKSPLTYPIQYIDSPGKLNSYGWTETIKSCKSGTETTLIELPSSGATPLSHDAGLWKDNADLALELKMPCLIVAKVGPDAIEKLILNTVYMTSRELSVIGSILVETSANFDSESSLADTAITLQERTGIFLFGCIRYSNSISVPSVNQGNLIKTTSSGLDLLPIIKSLNLRMSA